MADLPSVTDRLNDVEVAANAPLTETLMRRFGSNINFLLDFLGIADGSTTPSGDLNEFISALTLIGGHTMDSQAVFATEAGVVNVGTFTTQKFVNQVFYLQTTTYTEPFNITQAGVFAPIINIDGGGNQSLPFFPTSDSGGEDRGTAGDYQGSYLYQASPAERRFSKVLNVGNVESPAVSGEILVPFAEIDYRDSGTNFQLLFNAGNSPLLTCAGTIYRAYRLNAGSLGF